MASQLSPEEMKIAEDERELKERRKYLEGRETRLDGEMTALRLTGEASGSIWEELKKDKEALRKRFEELSKDKEDLRKDKEALRKRFEEFSNKDRINKSLAAGGHPILYWIMVLFFTIIGIAGTMSDIPNLISSLPSSAKTACFWAGFVAHVYTDVVERLVFVCKPGPPIQWLMTEVYMPLIYLVTRRQQ